MMFARGSINGFQGSHCFGYGTFGMGGSLMMILVVVLVGVLVWQLLKKKEVVQDNVFEILKLKYASGEITEEEYMRRREILLKK